MGLSGTFQPVFCFIHQVFYKQNIWNNKAYFHFWIVRWCKGMSVLMWKKFVFISLHITHYIFTKKAYFVHWHDFLFFSDISTTAVLYGWDWVQLISFTSENSLVQKIFSVSFLWGGSVSLVYIWYGRNLTIYITSDLKRMWFCWSRIDKLNARSNTFIYSKKYLDFFYYYYLFTSSKCFWQKMKWDILVGFEYVRTSKMKANYF